MEKNKEKREPLMYIHQPKFVFPEPVMQSTYHAKDRSEQRRDVQAEEKQEEQIQEKAIHQAVKKEKPMMAETPPKKRKERKQVPIPIASEPPVQEKSEAEEQPVWSGMRPVKRFNDMEMDEKLQHLMTQFTSIPCIFDCGKISHKGMLSEVTPDNIEVKSLKGENVTIDRKELQHIHLLGPL